MKFLILSWALAVVASAQQYGQHQEQYGQHHGVQQPPIAILRQSQDVSPDGSYSYNYETENGIAVSESGAPGPVNQEGEQAIVAQGQFQYTAPDGTPIAVTYTADENGFQAQGAHLPVSPPIPQGIQRSLEYNAAHPEQDHAEQYQQPQQPQQPQYNRRY